MSGDNNWPKPPPPNNSTAPTCVFAGHRSHRWRGSREAPVVHYRTASHSKQVLNFQNPKFKKQKRSNRAQLITASATYLEGNLQLPKPEKLRQKKMRNLWRGFEIEVVMEKKEKKGWMWELTGVQGGDGGIIAEVTILLGDGVFSEIIIESVRRRILHAGRVEAGSSSLDRSAIGSAGAAGPLDRWLQRRVLRVVLGHAPHLPRRRVAADKAT